MSQAVEAYRGITATEEFKYYEILRARTKHDEAQAIHNAELRGEQRANEKWQSVAEENERLRKQIAALQANQKA